MPTVHCRNKDSARIALKYTLTLTTHSHCYLAASLLFSHPPEPVHSVQFNVQALPSLTTAFIVAVPAIPPLCALDG